MNPPEFDADPHRPSQTPTLDPPVPPPRAVAHAATAEPGLNEEEEEHTLEEPGYGHGV
ncbi:MAG TPA: hypothetical protein VH458_15795 [Vicinamibacterales bacterium]|jgi:hypothetical protein